MKTASLTLRAGLAVVVLGGGAALRPRPADAAVYGLWRDSGGNLACAGECQKGQQCCEIKVLPAGG